MPNENLPPAQASYLVPLMQPLAYPADVQHSIEQNRRALLYAPLAFQAEEISGYLLDTPQGPKLRLNLQSAELDPSYKSPRRPVSVLATLAEWQAEFVLTPRLREKLAPLLLVIAPALLAPQD
jgi:hypothetical protein